MAKALGRLSGLVDALVRRLLFAFGLSMALLVAVQVFSRYALNHSLFWSEELARFFLVWLTFLGAGTAYHRRAHASIDVIYNRLPAGGRRAARILTHLCALVFSGIMVWHGVLFAWFVRLQISPALHLPKWIPHAVIPVSGAVLFIHALAFLATEVTGKEARPK